MQVTAKNKLTDSAMTNTQWWVFWSPVSHRVIGVVQDVVVWNWLGAEALHRVRLEHSWRGGRDVEVTEVKRHELLSCLQVLYADVYMQSCAWGMRWRKRGKDYQKVSMYHSSVNKCYMWGFVSQKYHVSQEELVRDLKTPMKIIKSQKSVFLCVCFSRVMPLKVAV